MTENDNDKNIEFLYRLNYFPGKKRLIQVVRKTNSEITENNKGINFRKVINSIIDF